MDNNTVQEYSVMIMRQDGQHITVDTTDDYDKAYEVWSKHTDAWVGAIKEKTAFRLERPIVTAFAPELIYEVRLIPTSVSKSTRNNPYAEEMRRKGFSATFGGNSSQGSDLLDGGYK